MDERQSKIIEAAIDCFCRYGMKRTTMGDIAEEAQISRQTLYANYPNKDEVLAAAIEVISDKIRTEIARKWCDADNFAQKLDIYFQHAVIEPYEMMSAMPDARDVMNGVGEKAMAVSREGEAQKATMLADQLVQYTKLLTDRGTDPKSFGEFIQSATKNFKYTCESRAELDRMLATLRASVLATIEGQAS